MGQMAEFASNHPFLMLALFAAGGAVVFYEIRLKAQSLTHVSASDAVKLINKGALVVDVRDPESFRSGHIVNARNIPLEQLQKDEAALKKHKGKVVVTVCDNGANAGKAANALRKARHEAVFSLKGGLSGWRTENLPLVK